MRGILGYFDLGDNFRMHKLGADAAAATAQWRQSTLFAMAGAFRLVLRLIRHEQPGKNKNQ
jgi:hypothetical protein